jgi:raffinose/stachyose/melibiose transport system permease protein
MIKFKNGTVRTLLYVILIIYSMSIFYPIFLMIITSLKENREIFTRPYSLPQSLNLDSYIHLFKISHYFSSFISYFIYISQV